MTAHRKLKLLVRDRMSATGESYTTARRIVLARGERRPLPSGLVPGYPGFGAEQHRESALLAHVLATRGATYSEAMLAGLAGGIGFMYAVFDYTDLPPLMTIVAQHHPDPWVQAALDRLGVPYTEQHSGKAPAAMTKLRAALAAGQPVLVEVDRSRLPWHGLEPGMGIDPRVVAVVGAADGVVHLEDDGVAPIAMAEDAFVDAWSGYRKGRHHAVLVGDPGPVDLPAAIRAALAVTVAHLTGPVLGNSFDVNFGFSGMAKLADQLRDTRTKTGWAKRFGAPVPFAHGVRRLYECLEIQHTAPGATRPVYADFLDEAAPLVDPGLARAAELFRRSGAKWSELATLALDSGTGLGYAELAEQRLALMISKGRAAEAEIRELTVRLDAEAAAFAATDPIGEGGRHELFAAMAAIVDTCLELEREAVAVLAALR